MKERENNEIAYEHRYYTILRQHYDAWKLLYRQKEPEYITLSLTTRDNFKQTKDNHWLKTRTFDFQVQKWG